MTADITGKAGKAWKAKFDAVAVKEKPHGLDMWLIHQPGVHAYWSWWFITGCDLYTDPDGKTWGKQLGKVKPGCTHEWLCFALNPESGHFAGTEPPLGWDSNADIAPARVWSHFMTPAEFVHQDQLRDSDQANEVMRLLVKAICDGHTVADADYRAVNIKMLAATCEHFRAGKHDLS